MTRLIALSYSPWSEKARWALDHHRVPYRVEHYVPMLGEPLLRLRTRRFTGPISVPALIDDNVAIVGSFEIARHAEHHGSGSPLFPAAHLAEIMRWNDRSDEALTAGRSHVVTRMSADREAQKEALPGVIPSQARTGLTALTQLATRFVASKYSVSTDLDAAEATIAGVLDELRAALDGRAHLLDGDLTYADIAAAVILQPVRPVRDSFIRLGTAMRACWTISSLAQRYADLLEWRDQLYEKRRRG